MEPIENARGGRRPDVPSWDLLRAFAQHQSLTSAGRSNGGWAVDVLERVYGKSWPETQFNRTGFFPPELLLGGLHRAAFPRLMWIASQAHQLLHEPSFQTLRNEVRRGCTPELWRHVHLQVEIARLARELGWRATFEPLIPESLKKADVELIDASGSRALVETASVRLSDADMEMERLEGSLRDELLGLGVGHQVAISITLTERLNEAERDAWVHTVKSVVSRVSGTALIIPLERSSGRAVVQGRGGKGQGLSIEGAPRGADVFDRLLRILRKKADQSRGERPVWLRIDAVNGLFQAMTGRGGKERLRHVAPAMRRSLFGAPHVAGVVLTSGPCVSLDATDAATETTDEDAFGVAMRRLLAPHLVRETLIVPLSDGYRSDSEHWSAAYSGEGAWLDTDLAALGLAPLDACFA